MYTNTTRGRHEVRPLEEHDRVLEGLHKINGYPDVQRCYSLDERQFVGAWGRKLAWWYNESASNQIHARMKSRTIVRLVYLRDHARYQMCDLVNIQR